MQGWYKDMFGHCVLEECIFCWCIGRGFKLSAKKPRHVFAMTKF